MFDIIKAVYQFVILYRYIFSRCLISIPIRVPILKLQIFSEIFKLLPIDYNLFEKILLEIFVYLFICEFTTEKVFFCFYIEWSQATTCVICEVAIFGQNSIVF